MEYRIRVHIDSYIEHVVEAESEEEAIKEVKSTCYPLDDDQILDNAQAGEYDVEKLN